MAQEFGPITLAMLKHHRIVNKMLTDFEKAPANSKMGRDLFNLFKKNLETHFYIEEAHIFPATDKKNPQEFLELKNLLKDHNDMRGVVENIQEELADKEAPNVEIFKELLFKHEGMEIKSFYPRFDKRLSDEEKQEMLDRVNEIRLG
jgi:hemerythrin superfamily protein